jgi:hypothetical protein
VGLQEAGGGQAVAYLHEFGEKWASLDLDDGGGLRAASGARGGLFWTHGNYNWDEPESTDIYVWLYPHP